LIKTPGCSNSQAFAPRVRAINEIISLPSIALQSESANRLTSGPSGISFPTIAAF
jgi:hypothetical protein